MGQITEEAWDRVQELNAQGLSQRQIADEVGISRASVARIVDGKRRRHSRALPDKQDADWVRSMAKLRASRREWHPMAEPDDPERQAGDPTPEEIAAAIAPLRSAAQAGGGTPGRGIDELSGCEARVIGTSAGFRPERYD